MDAKMQDWICNNDAEAQSVSMALNKAELRDIYVKGNDGNMTVVDDIKGVFNTESNDFCAAVSKRYTLIQHGDYFQSFAESLTRLGIKYKMTIRQSGNTAFADIDMIGRNIKFDKLNEEFMTGFRLINSYDRSSGISMMSRYTRLACMNGMILTKNVDVFSIRHSNKMAKEIDAQIEIKLKSMISENAELQFWVSESMKDSKEWDVCCKIIAKLIAVPKHRDEVLKRLGIVAIDVTDKKSKKRTTTFMWDRASEKKDKLTRWSIYNSITNYLLTPSLSPSVEAYLQKQAEKMLTKPLEILAR